MTRTCMHVHGCGMTTKTERYGVDTYALCQGWGTFFLSRAISIFSTSSEGRTNFSPLLKNTKITAHSFGLSFMLCKEKATSEYRYLTMTRACMHVHGCGMTPKQKDMDTRCVHMYLVSYPCGHDLSGGDLNSSIGVRRACSPAKVFF